MRRFEASGGCRFWMPLHPAVPPFRLGSARSPRIASWRAKNPPRFSSTWVLACRLYRYTKPHRHEPRAKIVSAEGESRLAPLEHDCEREDDGDHERGHAQHERSPDHRVRRRRSFVPPTRRDARGAVRDRADRSPAADEGRVVTWCHVHGTLRDHATRGVRSCSVSALARPGASSRLPCRRNRMSVLENILALD